MLDRTLNQRSGFTVHILIPVPLLRTTFPPFPRPHWPSESPPPTLRGPEPLWIHQRPTRPVVPSQPPVHATSEEPGLRILYDPPGKLLS
jgi:hypothetical protein